MKIEKPGIFKDFPEGDYFADPCPRPSITQSLAKIILEKSPLHAWYEHPRLNPDYHHDDDRKFDIGNIAHALMLGRGKKIVVLHDFDDWRTKEAKSQRDKAAAEGKLAVLGKHFAKADRMVKAAREQLENVVCPSLFDDDGSSEVVIAWEENGNWRRQMIDWLSRDTMIFADYKTTDMSAAPSNVGRMMVSAGWPIQAAMAWRGLYALDEDKGEGAHREFYFVVQETEVPYALTVVSMSVEAMTMGSKMLEKATSTWDVCLSHNHFPGYPRDVCVPEFPTWAEQQWLNREIADAARERIPQRDTMLTTLQGG
jgi:hypothetical protein